MSDLQKGLVDTLDYIWAEHKFCVRHLYANFKILHKGKALKDTLCNAARATTAQEFKEHMRALEELDKKAADWLKRHDHKCWSRHAFSTRAKSDMLLNNIAKPSTV